MHALGQQRAATASAAAAARAPARVVLECTAWTRRSSSSSPASSSRPLRARAGAQPQQQKGFGGPAPDAAGSSAASSDSSEPSTPAAAPARRTTAATRDDDAALEALEARLKSRRQAAKLEAKVKVESAAVRLGTGQAPGGAGGAGETLFVQFLGALFVLILVEGLVLAASGFLPEAADAAVTEWLYPSYSPQILVFLGLSSLYGLFKTGKLPGQKQI